MCPSPSRAVRCTRRQDQALPVRKATENVARCSEVLQAELRRTRLRPQPGTGRRSASSPVEGEDGERVDRSPRRRVCVEVVAGRNSLSQQDELQFLET